MKRWLGWFFAGLGVVFFLLSLDSRGHPLLVNSQLPSGWNRWLGTWTECVSSSSSTAIRAASYAVTRSRSAPLTSFATHSTHPGFLITGAIGPPGLDYRGPPGLRGTSGKFARLPVKPAAQAVGGARFPHEISAQAPFKSKIGVLQQPLASVVCQLTGQSFLIFRLGRDD
jgi:hypothetical protein